MQSWPVEQAGIHWKGHCAELVIRTSWHPLERSLCRVVNKCLICVDDELVVLGNKLGTFQSIISFVVLCLAACLVLCQGSFQKISMFSFILRHMYCLKQDENKLAAFHKISMFSFVL